MTGTCISFSSLMTEKFLQPGTISKLSGYQISEAYFLCDEHASATHSTTVLRPQDLKPLPTLLSLPSVGCFIHPHNEKNSRFGSMSGRVLRSHLLRV